ncbi:MAG: hypothetical protein HYR64_06215 [Fimbriimonas ginsengisoli]|uniref:Tetratricopeptide repeat protein n=1 Tax=Fimbriimonas ginsengisoli TaxID=1005039 RepID=A0A931M0I9_FIMGI|nr:hypothetical protein [Fimbriimonas ginsengisoli]
MPTWISMSSLLEQAELAVQSGRYAEACVALATCLSGDWSRDAEEATRWAYVALKVGDLTAATELITPVVSGKSRDAYADSLYVHTLQALGLDGLASWELRRALRKWPDDIYLLRQRVSDLERRGKRTQAEHLLERIEAAHPDDPANRLLAAGLYASDDWPRAKAALEGAILDAPTEDYTWIAAACAARRGGSEGEFGDLLRRAEETVGARPGILIQAAYRAREQSNWSVSLDFATRALALCPRYDYGVLYRCRALFELGEREEALNELERHLEVVPLDGLCVRLHRSLCRRAGQRLRGARVSMRYLFRSTAELWRTNRRPHK